MLRPYSYGNVAAMGAAVDPYGGADYVFDPAGAKNGGVPFYRSLGVSYASAALAGWTVNGGTFNASGYTPTTGEYVSRVLTFPTDWIAYSQFSAAPANNSKVWILRASSRQMTRLDATGGITYFNTAVPVGTGLGGTSTKAAGGTSGGASKSCYQGGAVSTVGTDVAPGSQTFYIGSDNGTGPWDAPIQLVQIHLATLSDAQIQALAV